VFLYIENEAASKAAHGFPLVLQHTFAIHSEFSLEISQLASSSAENVLNDSPETGLPPSPAGRCFSPGYHKKIYGILRFPVLSSAI
jgi:hypothetical protein